MKKRLIAILLTATMILTLAACGSKDNGGGASTEPASGTSEADTAAATEGEDEAAAPASDLDPVTLKMYLCGNDVKDDSKVMEELNKLLQEKINVTLEPIWETWGYGEEVVLSLQGGEDIDIYFTCSWTENEYNKFARDGYYVRLDDPNNNLIEKYASELWSTLPEVLTHTGASVNGADGYGVYAVPGYKDIATQNCWDINVPLLEKYGYTLDDIRNTDYYGFGEILQTVKDGEGADFYPLLVEGAVLERMVTNSIIVTGDSGTGNFMSYYLDPTDVSKESSYGIKLLNKYATDEFAKFAAKTREYFQNGFIDPACSNTNQANEIRTAKQNTGEYLIGTQSYSLGYELQASQEREFEVAMIPCTDPYVDTTSAQGAMMAISTASKNPERAMMFLNLLNTDPEVMTLMNYGVEGVHYNLTSDGCVEFTAERDNFKPWTNGVGNVTILPPTVEQGAGFWDTFTSYYGNAKEIPILGFAYDGSGVETEMSAVANVVEEYLLPLCTGAVDPETKLPEFLEKLEQNGVNTVLDDANAQLASFMESKG